MSGGGRIRVQASDEDWAALLAFADDEEPVEDDDPLDLLEPSEEVMRVSRRIAGQYVEVLARFAASAFGRNTQRVSSDQVGTAVEALLRLAEASGDTGQADLLRELLGLIKPATSGRPNSRSRQSALVALREWLPRYAATLETEDGERLVRLVEWDRNATPLLEELRGLHGIGPKRLQALYSAGLFTVDAVAGADPMDIHLMTSIPRELAESVVLTTQRFAREERKRCVDNLREGALRLRRILAAVPESDDDLALAASRALLEVERTLQDLGPSPETT